MMLLLAGCDALRVEFGDAATELRATRMHAEPEAISVVGFLGSALVVPVEIVHDGGPATTLSATVDTPWSVAVPAQLDVGGSVTATLSLSATELGDHSATLSVTGPKASLDVDIVAWVQLDADGDGHGSIESGGDDCDDDDDDVHPGAAETWYDDVDADCAGDDDFDADHDGAPLSSDCDDSDPKVGVGATEAWNGVDDDCDGVVDELMLSELDPWVEGDAADLRVGAARGVRAVATEHGPATWIVAEEDGEVWVLPGAPTDRDLSDNAVIRLSRDDARVAFVADDVGDPDGDGAPDLLVTTTYESEVYAGTWIVPGAPPAGDRDISSVAQAVFFASELEEQAWTGVLEDIDGDGLDDVAIGAPREDDYWLGDDDDEDDGRAVGAVALWLSPVTGSHGIGGDAQDDYVRGDEDNHHLGYQMAAGDIDGDGYGDLVVGEPGNDDSASDGGAFHVILGEAAPSWKSGIGRAATLTVVGDVVSGALGDTAPPPPTDLDLDGIVDLVLPNPQAGTVGVVTDWSAGVLLLSDLDARWSAAGAAGTATCITELGGQPVVISGAPEAAGGAGEVWTLRFQAGALVALGPITGGSGSRFGSACSAGVDLDANGSEDVLVGAEEWSGRAGDGGMLVMLPRW